MLNPTYLLLVNHPRTQLKLEVGLPSLPLVSRKLLRANTYIWDKYFKVGVSDFEVRLMSWFVSIKQRIQRAPEIYSYKEQDVVFEVKAKIGGLRK